MNWELIRYESMVNALDGKFRQDTEAIESGRSMPKLKPIEPTISEPTIKASTYEAKPQPAIRKVSYEYADELEGKPMTATFRRIVRMEEEKTGKSDEDILEAIL